MILTRGAPSALAALSLRAPGLRWVLGAVLVLGRLHSCSSPAGRPACDPLSLLAFLVAIGVAWMAPFYLRAGRGRPHGARRARPSRSVLYVALFASLGAYVLWNEGVARIGPSRAGVFIHLMPAFGSVLAVTLLGEAFRPFHLAGIALILAGVWLASAARPVPVGPVRR